MDYKQILVIIFSLAIVFAIVQTFFYLLTRNRYLEDNNSKLSAENSLLNSFLNQQPKVGFEKGYVSTPLTKRELEISGYVVEGLENKEIAAKLNLSHHTVNNHLENMKEKVGCRNKAELISYLIRNGIVD